MSLIKAEDVLDSLFLFLLDGVIYKKEGMPNETEGVKKAEKEGSLITITMSSGNKFEITVREST